MMLHFNFNYSQDEVRHNLNVINNIADSFCCDMGKIIVNITVVVVIRSST